MSSDVVVAVLALFTGSVVLVSAIVSAVFSVLNRRDARETADKTEEIHVLVNSRFEEMVGRVNQLVGALESAGVEVPTAAGPDEDEPEDRGGPEPGDAIRSDAV